MSVTEQISHSDQVSHTGTRPRPLDAFTCEQFLVYEARLLDEARFDEWLNLFTPDAWYWVPSEPNQASPRDTVSLIYDDRRLLETRVRRRASARIYSQDPRSRTGRIEAKLTREATAGEGTTPAVWARVHVVDVREGKK